jgi:chorismate mutase / prephenate dehydrogenase
MELEEIRIHLDRLDSELLQILAERMSLMPKVAEYKKKKKLQIYQPEREKEIIISRRRLAKELKLNPDFIEDIMNILFKEAHRVQKEIIDD